MCSNKEVYIYNNSIDLSFFASFFLDRLPQVTLDELVVQAGHVCRLSKGLLHRIRYLVRLHSALVDFSESCLASDWLMTLSVSAKSGIAKSIVFFNDFR